MLRDEAKEQIEENIRRSVKRRAAQVVAQGARAAATAAAEGASAALSSAAAPYILIGLVIVCCVITLIAMVVYYTGGAGNTESIVEGTETVAIIEGCEGENYTYECFVRITCKVGSQEGKEELYGDLAAQLPCETDEEATTSTASGSVAGRN